MLTPTTRTATLLAALCFAGCSTARTVDVLEARLRSQEDMLAAYQSEVTRVKSELSVARRETEDLRVQLAGGGKSNAGAEDSSATFRAAGIEFSSLMTGGTNSDEQPGHDGLAVVLVPHDHDGELVKLPGTIEIEAFDLSQPGGAQRIGHWTFDQRDVHEYWHKGVIQSGYQFDLPWQTPPHSDQVLLHGHLRTADGRKFDTTLTVKVDPPPTDGMPMVEGIQQAAADGVNPFAVSEAKAERAENEANNDIIWADGEGPAAMPPSSKPTPSSSTTANRQRAPRPGAPVKVDSVSTTTPDARQEVPPPIEDWWAADEWSTMDDDSDPQAVRTSDSFTDETIPRYR